MHNITRNIYFVQLQLFSYLEVLITVKVEIVAASITVLLFWNLVYMHMWLGLAWSKLNRKHFFVSSAQISAEPIGCPKPTVFKNSAYILHITSPEDSSVQEQTTW